MSDVKNEQFSLQWNNFHTNLSSGFHSFLQGQNLVDVTLAAGGKFIQAHKLVLSVCSVYFKDLFEVNPCKHPIVIMKDVGHRELEAILEFMYRGETNVCQDDLSEFLKTAEMLQVKGLADNDSAENQDSPGPSKPTPTSRASQNVVDKSPLQAPKRERSMKAAPPEGNTQPFKRVKHEDAASAAESQGMPTLKQPAVGVTLQPPVHSQSPPESPIDTQTDPTKDIEHVELAQPKMELVEIEDSDVEEVDNGDDFSFFGGETSQSFQDTSGAGSLPDFDNLSQYANMLQEDGQGAVQYVKTQKGATQLIFNDFLYSVNQKRRNKVYWVCVDYKKYGCRSRMIFDGASFRVTTTDHTHGPHTEKIKKKLLLNPEYC